MPTDPVRGALLQHDAKNMTHRNAPLTPEGRNRLIQRCRTRPIAHVAAEKGVSRATASKWVNCYRRHGELGLVDRSSAPMRQPTATPGALVARIESMRREHKWSASRIASELCQEGTPVSRRTVTRLLAQIGLNRRRFIDPNGENNREPRKIAAKRPGHMVHIDVKKTGRIPDGRRLNRPGFRGGSIRPGAIQPVDPLCVEEVEPKPLVVTVGERQVPAVIWQREGRATPLVLLGHGGSSHKTAPRQQGLAIRLVAAGMAVVAIDGPAHGARAPRPDIAPGEYQADLVARGFDQVVRSMVDDWIAAIGAARASGAVDGGVGYLGMSMGTRFGLPLAASLGAELTCVVLGKFGLCQAFREPWLR